MDLRGLICCVGVVLFWVWGRSSEFDCDFIVNDCVEMFVWLLTWLLGCGVFGFGRLLVVVFGVYLKVLFEFVGLLLVVWEGCVLWIF